MTYLLDVNVLLALGYREHRFYAQTMDWLTEIHLTDRAVRLATCSTTFTFLGDTGIPGALLIPDIEGPSGVQEPRMPYGVAA